MSKSEYTITNSKNYISKGALICSPQHVVLSGKGIVESDCIIRADLGRGSNPHISIGRYSHLQQNCHIRPGYKLFSGKFSFYPGKIGDYVTIGEGSIIESASIGNGVQIGRGCTIGSLAILKDFCKIRDGTVIPAGTVIPPLTEWGQAGMIGYLPESTSESIEAKARACFVEFTSSIV